jgi:Tol biopolymer transport system component
MGEVYRARDTRLDRTVAVKVLTDTLATDASFRERFAREARVISQLEHPNICSLYDIGDHDGIAFLVMQFLEGETLSSRLSRGPLPLEQALRSAIEIAGALDRAHSVGIIHRDLKPANVMLTKAGTKLLDFGLAKTASPAAGMSGLSMLPTTPPGLTAQGTILGTFQYMAPEQLEGQEADARTDIFAFGAVLYEMVTGRKAFTGKSPASLIGSILKDPPPAIAEAQPLTPPAFDRVVRTCLAKDPDERWQSARDLQRELTWIDSAAADSRSAPSPGIRKRVVWMVAGLGLAALTGLAAFVVSRPAASTPGIVRFELAAPPGMSFASGPANPHMAISPDGRRIAFTVNDASNRGLIVVRELGDLQSHPLTGTEIRLGASTGNGLPFWSPDSRYIGFFAEGALKKIDANGGPVQTLCRVPTGEGGTWNEDGTIVFAPDASGGLYRVSDAGGTPVPVTTLDASRKEQSHRYPWFLPDGRHFVFITMPNRRLHIGSLESPEHIDLLAAESKALYADGHLLFVSNGTLLAQPFDATRLQVMGESFPIAENIAINVGMARASFAASPAGVLTYRSAPIGAGTQLTWVDRTGTPNGVVGKSAVQRGPQLSPDGTRVAVAMVEPSTNARDVWLWDVATGVRTRFTFDAADEAAAVWSPDGSHLVFNSRRRAPVFDLFQKPSNGVGVEETILGNDMPNKFATSWSPDGRFIVFDSADAATSQKGDLWLLPMMSDRKPIQLTQTPFNELNGRFSPDGEWIAYQSDESGTSEVYVTTFVAPGPSASRAGIASPIRKLVSTAGGNQPRWRRDSKELFYLTADGVLMAVPIKGQRRTAEFGTPQRLFEITRVASAGGGYDVSADGQRFLINKPVEGTGPTPITVVLNWTSGFAKR